ncbi:hypothetical protein COI51_07110 [Bacillus toyonensis]|uniref:BclA C-terminal domain-containing protein n=1 Tax=Bacillus toyonensis TaxID=155322 RepID=A0AB73SAT3_9BACI|nr:hypothetical protein COO04_18620 [Bacillus toyonensis]PEI88323.1 hypothetical protein CN678_05470 [Bacillus toyonensis]PEK03330.1 hypothetical protein CN681_31660 [Bacillus toyonensis]PEK43414.1 hypothetical protein CN586_19700 [Bacillus toyonensis]PEL46490.1 hypothetical protein CN638_26890 [Bacillus toyonensis]
MIYLQDKNEKIKEELLSMALEIILPYRLTGPTGNTGPTESTGSIVTTNFMFANNTLGDPISVILSGTNIPLSGSVFSPAMSTSNYNNNLITNLIAGNTISLQLFGILSIVNLVGGGSTGASLTIIRID